MTTPSTSRTLSPATRPATSSPPSPGTVLGGFVLSCPDCETTAGPFPTRAEAGLLASVHDRLHHGTRPTATVSGGGVCESCRGRPATVVWAYPPAGAPFGLCRSCWTVTTGSIRYAAPDALLAAFRAGTDAPRSSSTGAGGRR